MKNNRCNFRDARRLKTLVIVVSDFETATYPVSVRHFRSAKQNSTKIPLRANRPARQGGQACQPGL
jgi:hypothetical protein